MIAMISDNTDKNVMFMDTTLLNLINNKTKTKATTNNHPKRKKKKNNNHYKNNKKQQQSSRQSRNHLPASKTPSSILKQSSAEKEKIKGPSSATAAPRRAIKLPPLKHGCFPSARSPGDTNARTPLPGSAGLASYFGLFLVLFLFISFIFFVMLLYILLYSIFLLLYFISFIVYFFVIVLVIRYLLDGLDDEKGHFVLVLFGSLLT